MTGPAGPLYGRRAVLLGGLAAVAAVSSGDATVRQAPSRTTSPGQLPAFRVKANAAMAAGAPITLGHAFAKGDVPAGSSQKLIVSTTGGRTARVQVDQTNAWSDGSLRFAALSFRSPIAFAARQVASFQLGIGSGALGGAALTPAQAAARFALKVKGGDYGRDTFTVDAASIVATKPRFTKTQTAGPNPSAFWELVRSGPLCTEVKVTGFLKRDRDGAIHSFDKAVLYLRAWSDEQGGILGHHALPTMRMENVYGPLGGTGLGGSLPSARAGVAELYEGSTLVRACGGPNDSNGLATAKLYPQSGWAGATAEGHIPWSGAIAAPSYMVAHDLAYLTRQTRLLPPYDLDTVPQPWTGNDPFIINGDLVWPAGLNSVSDNNDDERIGYIHLSALRSLLNPFDKAAERRMLKHGFTWAEWQIWQTDERSGKPVNTFSTAIGPSVPNPTFETKYTCDKGSPHWCGPWNATRQDWNNYGWLLDASHCPSPWVVPLLRTGHAHFQDQGVAQACAHQASSPSERRNITFRGDKFEGTCIGFYWAADNVRSQAWLIRNVGFCDRMMADDDPMRPYIAHVMDRNAAFAAVGPDNPENSPYPANLGYPYVSPSNSGKGVYGFSGTDGNPRTFTHGFVMMALGMEERVAEVDDGGRQGWRALLERWKKSTVDMLDERQGGSAYGCGAYSIFAEDVHGSSFTTVQAMLQYYLRGRGAYPPPSTGVMQDFGYVYTRGKVSIPLGYSIQRAGVRMMAWLDRPIERAPEVASQMEARLPTYHGPTGQPSTPVYSDSASDGWYPTWSFAMPGTWGRRQVGVARQTAERQLFEVSA